MHFPIIHTNFWDALIAVPLVMILTQFINPFGIFTIRLTHLSLKKNIIILPLLLLKQNDSKEYFLLTQLVFLHNQLLE